MSLTYIIGRGGNQPFPITADSVHTEHARLTVNENGLWTLEDLKGPGGNGTYILADDGEWKRVFRYEVRPETVIRLSSGGRHSYTFMAHRVLQPANDFSWEFERVLDNYRRLQEEEEKLESQMHRMKVLPMIVCAICLIIAFLVTDINTVRIVMGSQTIIIGLISYFFGANEKIKRLRKKRLQTVVCPNCRRPLSQFDVENRQCSICKAH